MSIALDPTELGFRRPFTTEVVETLDIRNTHHEPIAFKVKTTAPKLYCVRPNSGRIEAGQQVQVQVILQAMREDPPADAKCRDKFLVQSVAITADRESQNVADIWNHIDKKDIEERKIRVIFLSALDGPQNGRHHDTSEYKGSPPQPSYTDAHTISSAPVGPVSHMDSKPEGSFNTREAASHAHSLGAPPSATTTSSPAESAQLAELKATIARLQKQLQDQEGGLRQRNANARAIDSKERITAAVGSGVNPVAMAAAQEGVPVKIVAALCLVSFLLALLF